MIAVIRGPYCAGAVTPSGAFGAGGSSAGAAPLDELMLGVPRRRSDFGAGSASSSELSSFEEFFEVCPSRASSSAIGANAWPSSARQESINVFRCASRSSSSATEECRGHREIINTPNGEIEPLRHLPTPLGSGPEPATVR